ncbi:MAG TPA: glycosyltransferase family 9 protein [Ktedonobacterales bacterium]|nr:glycosyltransferase family 9 protein [Ktedonobacterales bacterium]
MKTERDGRDKPDAETVRRILVTAYGHIADVLPSLPAMRALKEAYPQARITVLAVGYVREMMEASPYVDDVVVMRDFKYKGTRRGKLEQFVKLARYAPRFYKRFDMVLVLHARSRFLSRLAWLTGAPIRAGFADVATPRMLTHVAEPFTGIASFRDENRRVLEAVRVTGMGGSLELRPAEGDVEAVRALLAEQGIGANEEVIGLHPGSHWTCQQWSAEQWATLADDLVTSRDARLVITGTADEGELARAIIERMKVGDAKVVDLTGRTNIMRFAALIGRMRLLVCVNSAASQIALAMNTPVVNLVGYENPVWTAPAPDEPMTIVRGCDDQTAKDYWCPYHVWGKLSQCHRAECVGIGGLSLIRPESVTRAVDARLQSQRAPTTTREGNLTGSPRA